MLPTKTILALLLAGAISVTEAVNINCYTVSGCSGGPYGSCTNIGPNICCNAISGGGNPHGAASGEFLSLPGGSSFSGYQQTRQSPCGQSQGGHSGATNACINMNPSYGQYAGFAWFAAASRMKRAVSEEQCKGKQEIDTITFANGTVHSLDGMTQAAKLALWDLAVSDWKAEKGILED